MNRSVFTGLDLRTVAVTLVVCCLAFGIFWAVYQGITYVRNLIRCIRIMQTDVSRLCRAVAHIHADKLHEKLHGSSHRQSTVPPPIVKLQPQPPPIPVAPTPGAVDWADDDGRPSADTYVKSP